MNPHHIVFLTIGQLHLDGSRFTEHVHIGGDQAIFGNDKTSALAPISAGPIRTLASSGIGNFQAMLDIAASRSPLRRNVAVTEVASAALFLLSELSSGVTGEILFVDGGFNITAL